MDRELTRREREDLVEMLMNRAWMVDARQGVRTRAPGQVIASLNEEQRRKLAQLTPADFQHRQGA